MVDFDDIKREFKSYIKDIKRCFTIETHTYSEYENEYIPYSKIDFFLVNFLSFMVGINMLFSVPLLILPFIQYIIFVISIMPGYILDKILIGIKTRTQEKSFHKILKNRTKTPQ